jgi:hypothetical protein
MTWSNPPSTCAPCFVRLAAAPCSAATACCNAGTPCCCSDSTCKSTAYSASDVGRLTMACADGIMWMHAACRSWDS